MPHVQLLAEGSCISHPVAAEGDNAARFRVENLWPNLQQQQLINYNSSAATAVAAQHLYSYIATGQLCTLAAWLGDLPPKKQQHTSGRAFTNLYMAESESTERPGGGPASTTTPN